MTTIGPTTKMFEAWTICNRLLSLHTQSVGLLCACKNREVVNVLAVGAAVLHMDTIFCLCAGSSIGPRYFGKQLETRKSRK